MNTTLKLGEHYIIDLSGCNRDILADSEQTHSLFRQAIHDGGLTIVGEGFHKFSPQGFTCFLLLSESHASLHAWPEHAYCAIDLFTCAIGEDMWPLIHHLREMFEADDFSLRKINREAEIVAPTIGNTTGKFA